MTTDRPPNTIAFVRSSRAVVGVALLLLTLGACAKGRQTNAAFDAALRASRPTEIIVRGPVETLLPDGNGRDGPHERFIMSVDGSLVEVDHNLSLAPRVPVTVKEIVTVHGQFEPDFGHPIIHYTHHATGRHEGGWIELNGRRYG